MKKENLTFKSIANRIRAKLTKTVGDSLVETLAAVLVVALSMTMLAGSIVSAANVNKRTKALNTALNTESSNLSVASGTATITHTIVAKDQYGHEFTPGANSITVQVYTTQDENHYTFYSEP